MNLTTLTMAATLAAMYPRSRGRTDRLALGACSSSLLVVFAVTSLVPAPHRLVLGTSVAALLVCLGSFAVVTGERLRGRNQAA